jgi:hypothetical protein
VWLVPIFELAEIDHAEKNLLTLVPGEAQNAVYDGGYPDDLVEFTDLLMDAGEEDAALELLAIYAETHHFAVRSIEEFLKERA